MKFALADVLMLLYYQGDLDMSDLIKILKDIFMIKNTDTRHIGLSQFKPVSVVEKPKENVFNKPKELKISDLMRRSV